MIVALVWGPVFAGVFGVALFFEAFIFVSIGFGTQFIELIVAFLLSTSSFVQVVELSKDPAEFVASIWIRSPRKPPDKSGHMILRCIYSPIDC